MRSFLVLTTMVVVAACSSGPAPNSAPRAARGGADLITEAEITAGSYATALDIVEALRPSMLRSRLSSLTQTSATGSSSQEATSVNPVVFIDEIRMGDLGNLRSVPAQTVKEIRYINSRDATTRWGTGVGSGVIQVITKK